LKYVAATLGIIWLFAVTFNYYIVHKPFTAENALAILNVLGDVLVAGALFALAAALGRRVTRGLACTAPLEAIVLQTGLGLGLISFATLALGLAGLVNRILFWMLLLLAAILLRNDFRVTWRDLRVIQLPIPSRFERALAWFITLSLAITFLLALTPPMAWDAQTYHLVIPKIALEQGRIAAPPDIVYFSFPSLGEMLFLAAMLLKGDVAAQVIHFGFLLLTLGAVSTFALRYFNARVAWLSAAVLMAVPSLVTISTWAYVDLALVFYAFAAFYALMIACETNAKPWLALSGALAGMAMGVKYTAVIVPVALLVILLLHILRTTYSVLRIAYSVSGFTFYVSRFTFFVILTAAPWYLRNLVFTGNPVYPFVFGGPYWDAFRGQWFSRFGTGLMNTPLKLLTLPWDATIYGVEGALGYEATIGPLLLMLLPLLLFGIRNSKFEIQNSESATCTTHHASPLRLCSGQGFTFYVSRITNLELLLIYSLLLYLFWLVGVAGSQLLQQTRLLFPAFPTLALAAAVALDRLSVLDLPQFSVQRFARLVIALTLGLTLLGYGLAFISENVTAYLFGFESREAYLARRLGGYGAAVEFVNTQLPRDAKVLFLWEPRSYYIRHAVQPDAILDQFAHLRHLYRDANAIARAVREQGYTHILLYRAGLDYIYVSGTDPIHAEDVRVLQEMLTRHARLMYGKTPLDMVDGKIVRANEEPYAIYELDQR
jgi:4-amino-4-deoxy-L-arabinose transferase-like glycosyltransferase